MPELSHAGPVACRTCRTPDLSYAAAERGTAAEPERMIRVFLIVLAAGVVLALLGLGYLGAFPPHPVVHHVVTVLPNSGFQTH